MNINEHSLDKDEKRTYSATDAVIQEYKAKATESVVKQHIKELKRLVDIKKVKLTRMRLKERRHIATIGDTTHSFEVYRVRSTVYIDEFYGGVKMDTYIETK